MTRRVLALVLAIGWIPCCGSPAGSPEPDPGVADPSPDPGSPEAADVPEGEDPVPTLDGTDAAGPDLPATGREPVLLLETQVPDDLGVFEGDPRLPLDPRGGFLRPLQVSPCGTLAWVFRNLMPRPDGTWDYSLVLQEARPWDSAPGPRWYLASAVGQTLPPPIAAWITFSEGTCEPRVWRLSDEEPRLIQWVPRPDGTMAPAPVLWDLQTPLGADPVRLDPVSIGEDRGGGLDLLVRADLGTQGTPLVHLRLVQGAWTVTRVPPAPFLSDLDRASFAFGSDGSLHVVVVQDDGLTWAAMTDHAWQTEQALPKTEDGVLLDQAHLALGSYDMPLLAHRHVEVLDQGLWQFLRLDLAWRPSGSTWRRETVADRNGIWRGDTDRWTGGAPRILTTASGRWAVSWLDLARLPGAGANGASAGGPRLAVRKDDGWTIREILPRSPARFPPSRFDVAEAVAADLDSQARFFGALVLERERPEGLPPGTPGTAWWRLWLVRDSL
ncbi:MAG TPA: hypothetical protein PLQ97_11500 [Myxococcota bacterium]|nr:hypothetical protein [Myxococcota bacterium]HQK51767.1 hypothetical protein [Myxococcota bacterium]